MKYALVATLIISMFLFSVGSVNALVAPIHGPIGHLMEDVRAHYYYNGTEDTAELYTPCNPAPGACRFGAAFVSLPNQESVLQDVRLNLSSITNTNLVANTDMHSMARVAVAATPTAGSLSRVLMNTSTNGNASYYVIKDASNAPVLNLSLYFSNQDGGVDIYDSDNIGGSGSTNTLDVTMVIHNPTTTAYNGIDVTLEFERNTGPAGQDSVNIIGGSDSDADGINDYYTWNGNLPASSNATITFSMTMLEGTNLPNDGSMLSLNFDRGTSGPQKDHGVTMLYDQSGSTLTSRELSGYYTKGSARQGVELSLDDSGSNPLWRIRGFIQNIDLDHTTNQSNNLSYYVTGWDMYDVNPATGSPQTLQASGTYTYVNPNVYLQPSHGRLYTNSPATNPVAESNNKNPVEEGTEAGNKPFYAASFDWSVVWQQTASGESQNLSGFITETMDLPYVKMIDIGGGGSATDTYPIIDANASITPEIVSFMGIEYKAHHLGHADLEINDFEAWAVVPRETLATDERGNGFVIDPNTFNVYVARNSTYYYNLTDLAVEYEDVDIVGDTDGLVHFYVRNLDLNISDSTNLLQNQWIIFNFSVRSDAAVQSGDAYNFTGNITFNTLSGTPITEEFEPETVTATAKILRASKDMVGFDPTNASEIDVAINLTVISDSGSINGIYFVDYVPAGAEVLDGIGGIKIFENGGTSPNGQVTDLGLITLPNGEGVRVYNYSLSVSPGTWSLTNGQTIGVVYKMFVKSSGVYVLPAIISAFDPDTGLDMGISAFGSIVIEVPEEALPLEITDEYLSLAKRTVVFKPGLWVKTFEVFNPNQDKIPSTFQTEVFSDAMQVYVTYIDNAGVEIAESVQTDIRGDVQIVRWNSVMNPLETRRYEIKVLTPPVTEIDRDVEVLGQIDDDTVKLKLDVYLKNLGSHPYDVVILNVPIGFDNILDVKDEFGNTLAFTGGTDASTITVSNMEASGLRTVSITYKQGFPTVIATPDKDRYDPNSPVGIEILVINGPETIEHPYLEIEVYTPTYSLVYADILELDTLDPLEQSDLYSEFVIPAIADPGFYIMTVRFRDSNTILSTYTGQFYVAGVGSGISTVNFAIIMIIGLALLFFSVRRLRETRKEGKR